MNSKRSVRSSQRSTKALGLSNEATSILPVKHSRNSVANLAYKVKIAGPALAEANDYVRLIQEQSNDGLPAQNWWNGLLDAIFSLETFPARCSRIPDKVVGNPELHQLLYASHRIIFRIQPGLVTVLRIYHASRKPLKTLKTGVPTKHRKQ